MNPDEDIFAEALRLPAAERPALLARLCAGTAQRERVAALLAAYEMEPDFLREPTAVGIEETEGQVIDRYKLLQKLGEGGFGVVWMAEQKEPVHRRVALKIIKPGMDTKEVVARFEAERQALAMMDHPNIARVFDGGATATGRPYFVMELVRGERITRYCDEHKLSTAARLGLFVQVCSAVQHAHQKGIIHRDLKPSNVLITVNDGVAVPKVIDFGIAKAIQGRLTDRTLFTAFEQFIGTPAYMSPEQAALTSLDIDTRSDIYSLGVLLYELLTGRTPFDTSSLLRAGLDEVRRVIREVDPPKPSQRFSTLGDSDRATTAQRRSTEPRRLSSQLSGDLDWIVMHCLDKDRTRRYETASGLALDIQRHLQSEPVVARPPSAAYRLRKFVRRNRLAVTAIAGIALALVSGLALATWRYWHEREARTAEAAARALAEQRQGELEAINRFLVTDLLGSADPEISQGRELTVKEVLGNAADRVDFAFRDQPLLAASVRHTLGATYVGIGAYAEAESHLTYALEQRRRLLGTDHPETLRTQRALGKLRRLQMKTDEAEQILREVYAAKKRTLGPVHEDTLATLLDLSLVLSWSGKDDDRQALIRPAWEEARAQLGPQHLATLQMLHQLVVPVGPAAEASAEVLDVTAQLLAAQRRALGDLHPETVGTLSDYGVMLSMAGRYQEAEPLLREAVESCRRLFGPLHLYTAGNQQGLAAALYALGRSAEGEAILREAIEAARAVPGAPPAHSARIVQSLWSRLRDENRHAEAAALVRGWAEHVRLTVPPDGTFAGSTRASCLYMLGTSLVSLKNYPEAEVALREALMLRERYNPKDYRRYSLQSDVGECLAAQGRFAEAEPLLLAGFEGVYAHRERIPQFRVRTTHPLLRAVTNLIELYDRWPQPEKAAAWRKRLEEIDPLVPPSAP